MSLESLFAPSNQAVQAPTEREKSLLWINVGYYVETVSEQTGEVVKTFVSIPFGIPLDTMKPANTAVSNKELAQIRAAQNALLEALKKHGLQQMKPGEVKALPNLSVELRRVAENVEVGGDNPLTAAISSLF